MAQNLTPAVIPIAIRPNRPLPSMEDRFLASNNGFSQYPRNLPFKSCSEAALNDYCSKFTVNSDNWLSPRSEADGEAIIMTCELKTDLTGGHRSSQI
jgi:hypothetical protein